MASKAAFNVVYDIGPVVPEVAVTLTCAMPVKASSEKTIPNRNFW
jgi:hypothetical protein